MTERLENMTTVTIERRNEDGSSLKIVELDYEDYEYLMQQAERVEELEGEIEGLLQTLEDKEPYYSNLCLMLEKQIQRYKHAIESIENFVKGTKYELERESK